VIGCPSTVRTTSPGFSPALSAAPPDCTELTCGCTFGSTPMSPNSNRLCPTTAGVTLRVCSKPLRSSLISTSRWAVSRRRGETAPTC